MMTEQELNALTEILNRMGHMLSQAERLWLQAVVNRQLEVLKAEKAEKATG